MNTLFILLFIFAFGCIIGWNLELVFRRIISENKRWINPGFLVGPYIPLYGFGISFLYMIANAEKFLPQNNKVINVIIIIVAMGIAMTVIEYVAGIIFVKKMKIKLWDYANQWGNIQGIICPLYSFFWTILGVIYYFFIHPYILHIVTTSFKSVFTYFILGMFYGVFIIDLVYSFKIVAKIKRFAEEQQIVVKLEELKVNISKNAEERRSKTKFFLILSSGNSIHIYLKNYHNYLKKFRDDIKTRIKEDIKRRLDDENKL